MGPCPDVALANFTNINYDFISSQPAVLSTSFSFSISPYPSLSYSPLHVCESLRLWRNLINFTLLEESCAGCQKSVQMINELINMPQKFSPRQLLRPCSGGLKMVACGKCNYALCDLRKFSLHTFRLGRLQVALAVALSVRVAVPVAVAKRVNDIGHGHGRHCATVGGAGWACPANVAKFH